MSRTNAAPTRIDLRSDTVTKPCPDMLAAMSSAEVGDDVICSDPTVERLQAKIAETLGKSNQAVKISLFRTRRAMEARLEELGIQAIA